MLRIVKKCMSVILTMALLLLVPSVALAEVPINIDGYYDDWSDKPHAVSYYGGYNGGDLHNISLFSDDALLYGHVKMNNVDGHYFLSFILDLTINDTYKIPIILLRVNSDNTINMYTYENLPVGNTLDIATFNNEDKKILGVGAVSVYDVNHSNGDEVEFSLNKEQLRKYCDNIPVSEMRSFLVKSSSIGNQEFTITGTSTAPYIGVIITLLLLLLVLLKKRIKLYRENKRVIKTL